MLARSPAPHRAVNPPCCVCRRPALPLRRFERETISESFGSRFAGGVADFYAFRLPIDPTAHARMHLLLLFAVFAFTGLVAAAVAARRAVPAVLGVLVAAGWPSTLLAGGHAFGR